jgi:hypothetical protein
MMQVYDLPQAVAWIEKLDAAWVEMSDRARAAAVLYPSHGAAPETKNPCADDDLLAALRSGRIVATDASGDVLPNTKWNSVEPLHLRYPSRAPEKLAWLRGVRLNAESVRKLWPSEPPAARARRRIGEAVKRDVEAFAKRAIEAGEKVKRDDFIAACQAETNCQRALAGAAYKRLPKTIRVLRGEKIGKR